MQFYNFKSISIVPNSTEFCDIILSKTQRKTPTVIHKNYKISRIRSFYTRKIKTTEVNFNDRLSKIIQEFPKIDSIHPFYSSLLDIYYDKDHFKIGLGQINAVRNKINKISKEYCSLVKYGDSLFRCKQLKKIAFGKMVTVIKKIKSSLEYLEQVRKHLSRLPFINPYTRTLIICGFPNVGKSSFLNKLTKANVEVQPYPFTTKSLYVGHMDYKYLRWQLIDTPGILDKKLEDRNVIEMQSITALAHLRSAVLFFIDISENCGHSIDEQIYLFNNIKVLFSNKPIIIVCNKIDLLNTDDLDARMKYINNIFSKEDQSFKSLSVLTISTLNNIGIDRVQDVACDSLLSYRIENKLNLHKANVMNKLYIAYPKVIDKTRNSCSPLKKDNQKTVVTKNKLERDIELEMGDDYILDLKKKYDILDEYKYDKIPEIWEGHNIIDYIQPNLFDKLNDLEKEETERENSGFYSIPKTEQCNDMKMIKELAEKIRERKIINRLESRIKKHSTKPKLSRTSTPYNILRNYKEFKNEMANLGVVVNKNFKGKSLVTKRKYTDTKSTVLKNDSTKEKLVKYPLKKIWRYDNKRKKSVSESDRFIGTKRPKHLLSGKHGIGKCDRR